MEKSHKFPFSLLTDHFLIPNYIFSTSAHIRMLGQTPILRILKFFPTPETVAPTRLLFQCYNHFMTAPWLSYQLLFDINMHNWECNTIILTGLQRQLRLRCFQRATLIFLYVNIIKIRRLEVKEVWPNFLNSDFPSIYPAAYSFSFHTPQILSSGKIKELILKLLFFWKKIVLIECNLI